jgi:hydrogenase 3 maturation protease
MQKIREKLASRLRGARKIAILGVGSDLRGDDAAGLLVSSALAKTLKTSKAKVFLGDTAPENLTGEIRKFKPTHLIIIDSADFELKPGSIMIFDPGDIAGISFSTHRLPLKLIADYLHGAIKCKTVIIGIQPKGLKFDSEVSAALKSSVKILSGELKAALRFSLK